MYANIISIDRNSDETLQTQIRRQLAIAIIDRQFPLHRPLPSIRRLSKDLGVSITTVVTAYDLLRSDGFLIGKGRSGFFINPDAVLSRTAHDGTRSPDQQHRPSSGVFTQAFKRQSFDLPRMTRPPDCLMRYRYPFISAVADPSLFPLSNWRECARDSTNMIELRNWAADFSLYDDELLVENLIQRVLVRRGIHAHPDEVLITIGGQQGLHLTLKLLHRPGDRIGIESPGYPDIISMAQIEGITALPLAIDRQGMVMSDWPKDLTSVYVTPHNQYPTNVTLTQDRREALLRRARDRDLFVIEDDYDSEITFGDVQPPALKSMDREGRVIYVGSLVESLMPGLRIGFIVADRAFIREAKALRHHILRHPPVNNQRTVALFLQRGYFDRHLTKLRREYADRCDTLYGTLEAAFPGHTSRPGYSGSTVWFRLPKGIEAEPLLEAAQARSLFFETVAPHEAGAVSDPSFIRLGFSVINAPRIREGIAVLRDIIHDQQQTA